MKAATPNRAATAGLLTAGAEPVKYNGAVEDGLLGVATANVEQEVTGT